MTVKVENVGDVISGFVLVVKRVCAKGASEIWGGPVWRGIGASGGWGCLPAFGRVRGQAPGRHVRGSDGTGGTWSGWTLSIRHLLRISTPGRRRMLLGGALRGRSPRTREGRLGPTAQMQGERREKHHFICRQLEGELTMDWYLPKLRDWSSPFWDAPCEERRRDNSGCFDPFGALVYNS